MPSFLLSLGTDAWPAMFFISQKILSAFNISNNISTFSFKSFCTCSNCSLNVNSTFNLKFCCALLSNPWGTRQLHLNFGLVTWINQSEDAKSCTHNQGCFCHRNLYYNIIRSASINKYLKFIVFIIISRYMVVKILKIIINIVKYVYHRNK